MASLDQAETADTVCVGCGNETSKRNRRIYSSDEGVKMLYNEMLLKLCVSAQVIQSPFMCRACYTQYCSLLKLSTSIINKLKSCLERFPVSNPVIEPCVGEKRQCNEHQSQASQTPLSGSSCSKKYKAGAPLVINESQSNKSTTSSTVVSYD